MATIAVLTFNCAKQQQPAGQVAQLVEAAIRSGPNAPDYIAVCLQELAPIHDASLGWVDPYLATFLAGVPSHYPALAQSVCGGTGLVVFGREDAPKPERIEVDQTPFGAIWSSLKGGALVSLQFGSSKAVTFVSAHLAAGENQKQLRNRDFAQLYEVFDLAGRPGLVVVAGDLNYRTRDGTLGSDELNAERQAGAVAVGLEEAAIEFGPTYKYVLGTNAIAPKRTPSFCDRVLYRPLPSHAVHAYTTADLPMRSDHKPVWLVLSSSLAADPRPSALGLSAASQGNRLLVSCCADLLIGSAMYAVHTPNGRLGLGAVVGMSLLYLFLLR